MGKQHTNLGDKLTTNESEPQLHLKLAGSLKMDGLSFLIDDDDEELMLNQDTRKFLKGVDYIKRKLGKFDAKRIDIAIWFQQFEDLAGLLGWSNKQSVHALTHLLGPALDRLVLDMLAQKKEPKYCLIRRDTISLVNKMLAQGLSGTYTHLRDTVFFVFIENKFANPEKRYWLECIASPQYLKELSSKLQDSEDLALVELIEMCFK